jgi:Domain of unknown function (DUF4153)
MTGQIANRLQLASTGALGGALLWLVINGMDENWIDDRAALPLVGLVLTLFGALLAMAGPLGLVRALPRALGLAVVAALLVTLSLLRYDPASDFFDTPMPALAGIVVATLPIPFLIASAGSGWRDYPTLFMEAWSVCLRYSAAAAFTGLIWLVIFLSDEVLKIVGIRVISDLLDHEVVVLVVTGAVLGLAMAVIYDQAELLSPYLVLRMFRLVLPVVLAVMVIFLIALPIQGINGLVSGLSPAMLLLAMIAAGIALVTIAVDQTDAEAALPGAQLRAAQGMAVILPILAALALWAIWLRVGQYGWSPERLFIFLLALIGLGYGLAYAAAVLRGAGWMERIRQGNIRLALGVIVLAALWLTPLLNAERISARNQLARLEAGKVPADQFDLYALQSWGRPGAAALTELELKSREPGQEALAKLLAGETRPLAVDRVALEAALIAAMPLQPATATGTRDTLIASAQDYQLEDWLRVCSLALETAQPACLMVVADLMPTRPGEEAMLFLERGTDYVEIAGLYIDDNGSVQSRPSVRPDGRFLDAAAASALLRQYQKAPPPVTAAMLNQLGTGETGLMILP